MTKIADNLTVQGNIVATGTIGGTTAFPTSVAYTTNAATTGVTLTAGNISGGTSAVYLALTGTLGAPAAAQLPLVTALVSALTDPVIGSSYALRVINESGGAFVWTVTTNTGWTLNGLMTLAQNTWRDFTVTLTSLTAAVLQNVGTGTYS